MQISYTIYAFSTQVRNLCELKKVHLFFQFMCMYLVWLCAHLRNIHCVFSVGHVLPLNSKNSAVNQYHKPSSPSASTLVGRRGEGVGTFAHRKDPVG